LFSYQASTPKGASGARFLFLPKCELAKMLKADMMPVRARHIRIAPEHKREFER
jgi:hypothetical protein